MKKIYIISCILLICIIFSACNMHNEKQATENLRKSSIGSDNESQNCISPIYDDYYYAIRKEQEDILLPGYDFVQLPADPWSIIVDISEFEILKKEDIKIENIDLVLVRNNYDDIELWFQDTTHTVGKNNYKYFIYSIQEGTMKLVETEYNSIILDQKSKVWGSNKGYFNVVSRYGVPETNLLGLYDEFTNNFSAVEDLAEIDLGITVRDNFLFSTVFFDEMNKVWIYVPGGSLYSYDLQSGNITIKFDELKMLKSVALGPDENIYFLISTLPIEVYTDVYYYIAKLDPNTMEIEQIDLQYLLEPYPNYFQTIYIDHTGRLWLDNVAFVDIYGNLYDDWYQIKRDSVFISPIREYYTDYRYKKADVLLESSDGKIWYRHNNGMIYLDPDQGTWCWFTTYGSNIVEDSEGNLWMIADGKLYRRPVVEQ